MNKTQMIILLTTVIGGMDAAGVKPKLKSSEGALLQYELLKLIEENGGEAAAEEVFEDTLHEAVQQLYNEITKA